MWEKFILKKYLAFSLLFALMVFPYTSHALMNNSVAYIYFTDISSAESYKSLLDENGYTTTLIPISDVANTDFTEYSLIIVGSDTSFGYDWGNQDSVSSIKTSGIPVLGLGYGGAGLFQNMDLSINWGNGWIGAENNLYVVDQYHIIFNFPNSITIPEDRIIQLYFSSDHIGEYAPESFPTTVLLDHEPPEGIIEVSTYIEWRGEMSQYNPESATFTISGPITYFGSGSSWIQSNVSPGTYTITYGSVSGYKTPPSETKTLSTDEYILFSAGYNLKGIAVSSNIENATFDISGPATFSGGGIWWSQPNAPPGTYTITYGPVSGYFIPSSETETLSDEGLIHFFRDYVQKGITVSCPDIAKFNISGPATFSGTGTFWSPNAPPGVYTITYGPISGGYKTPPSETKTLSAGGSINFSGYYKEEDPQKKKAGDRIYFGGGYVLIIKNVDSEEGKVVVEFQLDDRTIDEKILRIKESISISLPTYIIGKKNIIVVEDIYHDILGDYAVIGRTGVSPMVGPHTTLVIDSNPPGADILIDNEYVGKTKKGIPITDIGDFSLRLELDGYKTVEKNIQFEYLSKKEILINLNEINQTPTIPTPTIPTPTIPTPTIPTPTIPTPTIPTPTTPASTTPASTTPTPLPTSMPQTEPGFLAITIILIILFEYLILKK